MITCKELRARARASLDNNIFSGSWLFALLACLLVNLVNSVLTSTGVLSPAAFVIYGCLQIGLCTFFLESSRKTESKNELNSLFTGFTSNLGRNIIVGILYLLFIFLWTLLFIIPGIIMKYAYSMTFFILKDYPEYTAMQAIQESKKMMKGYKMKAFLLDLSFIGWCIVGALCCGIGTLWVTPYMMAAKTELYEEIKRQNDNTLYQ